MKPLIVLLQLFFLAVSLFFAEIAALAVPLSRGFVLGAAGIPLSARELSALLLIFGAFHLPLYLISFYVHRDFLFETLDRVLDEVHVVILGTTFAMSYIFLFSDISFNPNVFAYAYIFNSSLYVLSYLAWRYVWLPWKDSRLERLRNPLLASVRRFFFGRLAMVTYLVAAAVGLLGVYYKENEDFRNSVNYLKVSWNIGAESSWDLKSAFPGESFDQPIEIRSAPRDHVTFYVLEREGRLYAVSPEGHPRKSLVLDIKENVGGTRVENGALSFAFHPEFGSAGSENRGFAYIYYTHSRPGIQRNRLSRFDLSLRDLSERRRSEVILIDQGRIPNGFHNGGSVLFGPDGFLYLSIGNIGDSSNNQRLDGALAAGIFRIDVDKRGENVSRAIVRQPIQGRTAHYYIPMDNPFYGRPEVLEEFWALGFRNPFRMSIDRITGDVWVGDVGDELYEEINRVPKGSNGQASYKEGLTATGKEKPETIFGEELIPVYFYRQTALKRAVIGGVVYRGNKYPELYGHYIFADNQAGLIWAYDIERRPTEPLLLARVEQLGQNGITSVYETSIGDIYITVLGSKAMRNGEVLSVVRTNSSAFALDKLPVKQKPTSVDVSEKYEMLCSRCHGSDGKGAIAVSLDRKPTNFTLPEWQKRVSDDRIKEVIIKGGAVLGLSRDMPAWNGVFNPPEMELMVKKIRSFGSAESAQ